jgi:hypothetical protein
LKEEVTVRRRRTASSLWVAGWRSLSSSVLYGGRQLVRVSMRMTPISLVLAWSRPPISSE